LKSNNNNLEPLSPPEKLAELELLREEYDDLKKEHSKERSRLQEEMTRTSSCYQDLESSRDILQDENVRLTEDLTRIQKEHATQLDRCREENCAIEQELERQIILLQGQIEEQQQQLGAAAVPEKLAELELLREKYDDLKKDHSKEQSRLQEELARTSNCYQDLERSRDALQDENVCLTEDLTRIQNEHATQLDRCQEESRAIEQELERQITSLQGQIEEQGRLLDISESEVIRIRDRLQGEVEGQGQDKNQHARRTQDNRLKCISKQWRKKSSPCDSR
jgi:chromosome segregation ATPase